MTDETTKDPLGEAIRRYFYFRDQSAARMTAYQSEQRDFIRNLTSSGMTAAEVHLAAADFKKASSNYAGVTESLKLADDAMRTARDLYNIEMRFAGLDTTVQHTLTQIDWADVIKP